MSKYSLMIERAGYEPTSPALMQVVPRAAEYLDLIRHLFQAHSVVALVGCGSGSRGAGACGGIAAELAASGDHVVIVHVDELLRTRQFLGVCACLPSRVPHVSHGPSTTCGPVELCQSRAPAPPDGNWLVSLLTGWA